MSVYTLLDNLYRHVLLPPVRRITSNDAEVAHLWFSTAMQWFQRHHTLRRLLGSGPVCSPLLEQQLLDGLHFPSPFGTAAGLDKDADQYLALFALMGVGHVEVGAVTERSQSGNPRPRLVRADKDHLINAMGFPNQGVEVIAPRLTQFPAPPAPLGAQIGLNKDVVSKDAPESYATVAEKLLAVQSLHQKRRLPDFLTINVSSPNTPGLRDLQDPQALGEIVEAVCEALDRSTSWSKHPRKRLLLKFAPDLQLAQLEKLLSLTREFELGGVILTNTTLERPIKSKFNARNGGFSGSRLYDRAAKMVKYAAGVLPEEYVIVAVGGIDTADRAYEMLHYAQLVQSYTALVLRGPYLFREIAQQVEERLKAEGLDNVSQLRDGNRPKN